MAGRDWRALIVGLAWLGVAPAVAADDGGDVATRDVPEAGPATIRDILARHLHAVRRKRPEWILEQSHDEIDPGPERGDESAQLVLQQDRRDAADLLTLRYPLADRGDLRAYAGAGLNQVVYFEDGASEPQVLSRRNRARSVGAAAELGAELRVSEQLLLQADVRWIELANDAVFLRTEEGLVGADAVAFGVSIGWHFR